MNDKVIGNFRQQGTLCDISLFLACIALVVGNDLSLDQLSKRLVNTLETLDLERQRIEVLQPLIHGLAVRTNSLIADFASEDIFDDVLERRFFEGGFDPVEENVQELL